MATLHFNTDAGRATSSQINNSCNMLIDQLNTLNSRINAMVGADWMGNSANQFQGEFQNWASQMQQCISALETLRTRLDSEINEWEVAASTLG